MSPGGSYQHWSSNGVEAVRATNADGATPWHTHDRLILGRVDRGTRHVETRSGGLAIPAGSGFLLPPRLAHRALAAGPCDYLVLCVPAEAVPRCADVPVVTDDPDWLARFDRAFEALCAGQAGEDLARLADCGACVCAAPQAPPPTPHAIAARLREIDAAPEGDITLSELAAISGLSPFHFQRLFVRTTGLSPRQARLVARLHRARALLLSGVPVAETAIDCGFSDQSHLTREFRRWTGVPPARYLGEMRKSRAVRR